MKHNRINITFKDKLYRISQDLHYALLESRYGNTPAEKDAAQRRAVDLSITLCAMQHMPGFYLDRDGIGHTH